jgi:hypothetical protein
MAGGLGGGMPGDGAGPWSIQAQQGCRGSGECNDLRVLPGCGGVVQAGEQGGALGSCPR